MERRQSLKIRIYPNQEQKQKFRLEEKKRKGIKKFNSKKKIKI